MKIKYIAFLLFFFGFSANRLCAQKQHDMEISYTVIYDNIVISNNDLKVELLNKKKTRIILWENGNKGISTFVIVKAKYKKDCSSYKMLHLERYESKEGEKWDKPKIDLSGDRENAGYQNWDKFGNSTGTHMLPGSCTYPFEIRRRFADDEFPYVIIRGNITLTYDKCREQ